MKITSIKTTPLLVPYSKPYHWAQGVIEGAGVVLVEVHTDEGIVGYGESVSTPSAEAIVAYLKHAAQVCINRSPFQNARLMADAYHALFQAFGTCSSPRFGGRVLAGLEMALWDVAGKAVGRPAHELMGGAVHDEISYFGFAQGDTAEEVAADASELAAAGFEVIYFKVGRGDGLDIETTKAVRTAIGPDKRIRVDPNEQWNPIHAGRMIRKLMEYDVEAVEQPTHCESVAALAQVRASSPIAISADQVVFTHFDAYDVCRQSAADLIVIGLHETGGLTGLAKVAHIAEAADINICLHGLYETGITTCAANQVAATIPNLDDANQHMNRFLAWDIVKAPDLRPINGRLPVLKGAGLGFQIDWDNVERAKQAHLNSASIL
ncbi:L-alanine-DL-glutamate epimerase-like enolase superfamily enzyme [Pseudaminobacter salicylatoxidans]|uniref:L-alanine-DL-glutamate epimerase-like enolase superfamily enzyme n=1 Tax=Pseudaminobacter salicylatoxidans TaxID=93369 RepID=A0A316BJH2_PSESE|nr:mandelate racemase/muconate lactonizing enzyme family protein [Pseudaminobacter salicylatoxidans]PWJ73012.1 L-alanine-DL-glutamate epimerase-like enolase superfamily enzyme [Pseudaminobacter salicylatoxidans]